MFLIPDQMQNVIKEASLLNPLVSISCGGNEGLCDRQIYSYELGCKVLFRKQVECSYGIGFLTNDLFDGGDKIIVLGFLSI